MKRVFQYLFVQCGISSLAALLVLTLVVMLPQVLRLVDLWVNKGVSVAILGKMTFLSIPQFLVAAIPMALLIGTLMTLGRMAQESELVAFKACGISLFQIMKPIGFLALLYMLLALVLNMVVLPYSFHQFSILKKALVSSTTLALKANTFNHTIPGLTIYVDEQDIVNRQLKGVLVHDQRQTKTTITLTARSGQVTTLTNGDTHLVLHDGTRHEMVGKGVYRDLMFAKYSMDLGIALGLKTHDVKERLDEMNLSELSFIIQNSDPNQVYEARMEWHRRWAFPAATLILGLFAVPLGMQQSHRSGRSYAFVVAVLTLIIHFFLLSLGESLAHKQVLDPISGYWLPNLLMAALTSYVVIQTHLGHPFRLAVWLTQSLSMLPQRMLRAPIKETH